jgi:all-trans-8'-apo-beta-carotenal 15,15'-oxygenase
MSQFSRRAFGGLVLGGAVALSAPAWATAASGWQMGFQTPPAELDGEVRLVSGRLPRDLEGVFYRIGPAQFERAGERLGHWFDGDGMIQRFAIADGRVRHRGRFVQTDKRRAEQAAGRFLYSGFGFAPREATSFTRPDEINAANTNLLPIGDEVWALWEGGSPYRVGAEGLETRGRTMFDGQFDGAPFSAHPKVDANGESWNFGALGRRCVLWHLAANGVLIKAKAIELPEPSMMHSFAMTARHIVLLLPPMLAGQGPANTLVDRFSWRPDVPLIALVFDKDTFSLVRRHELPARFLFHVGNAWEDEAGAIRLDAFLDDDATFAVQTSRDLAQARAMAAPTSRLHFITLHADGRSELAAFDGVGEFPRANPRHTGQRHRFTYGVTNGGVGRWDLESGQREVFDYGPNTWSEESVFVPRRGGGEANGWLLTTMLDYGAGRTDLCVFDARRVSDGPVARLACPYTLPLGFHGVFVPT